MSWEYVHLITHPFAIVLSITGALVGLAGWIFNRDELEWYGVLSLLLAGVFAVPSYFTGIAAADVVADRIFVRPSVVQTHRSWATWAAVTLVTAGIFAGFAVANREDRALRRLALVAGLAAAVLTGMAAIRGGAIEHGVNANPPAEVAPAAEAPADAPADTLKEADRP